MSRSVAFSPDGIRLVAGFESQTIQLWDVSRGVSAAKLQWQSAGGAFVTFRSDGKFLASVGGGNTVRLWNVETGGE